MTLALWPLAFLLAISFLLGEGRSWGLKAQGLGRGGCRQRGRCRWQASSWQGRRTGVGGLGLWRVGQAAMRTVGHSSLRASIS